MKTLILVTGSTLLVACSGTIIPDNSKFVPYPSAEADLEAKGLTPSERTCLIYIFGETKTSDFLGFGTPHDIRIEVNGTRVSSNSIMSSYGYYLVEILAPVQVTIVPYYELSSSREIAGGTPLKFEAEANRTYYVQADVARRWYDLFPSSSWAPQPVSEETGRKAVQDRRLAGRLKLE